DVRGGPGNVAGRGVSPASFGTRLATGKVAGSTVPHGGCLSTRSRPRRRPPRRGQAPFSVFSSFFPTGGPQPVEWPPGPRWTGGRGPGTPAGEKDLVMLKGPGTRARAAPRGGAGRPPGGDGPAGGGPRGAGPPTNKPPPLHWSPTRNVRWKVRLPDEGNS